MNKEEFIKLIESIGFIDDNDDIYVYKEYAIYLFDNDYSLFNGYNYFLVTLYNDLTPIYNNLKKELRSIKLKELLR